MSTEKGKKRSNVLEFEWLREGDTVSHSCGGMSGFYSHKLTEPGFLLRVAGNRSVFLSKKNLSLLNTQIKNKTNKNAVLKLDLREFPEE